MTKDDLFAALTLKAVPFETSAGIALFLRPMKVTQRIALERWRSTYTAAAGEDLPPEVLEELFARLFIGSVCDESGRLVFEAADLDQVREFDPTTLREVGERAVELNGLSPGKASTASSSSSAGSAASLAEASPNSLHPAESRPGD